MDHLPARIQASPILEAVFELRYEPSIPADSLAELIFASLRRFYPEMAALPLAALPEKLRALDPNLAFQPTHQLQNGHHLLKIGARTLSFSSFRRYDGWAAWSAFINLVLENLEETRIIRRIERIGLRYVNLFPFEILDRLQCAFTLHGTDVRSLRSQYRVEIPDSGILKVLQLSNNIPVQTEAGNITGSMVDIDCLQAVVLDQAPLCSAIPTYADHLHLKAKELFFSLLTPDFLEQLGPQYE